MSHCDTLVYSLRNVSRGVVPRQSWFQKIMDTLGYQFLTSKGSKDGVDTLAASKEFSNVTRTID